MLKHKNLQDVDMGEAIAREKNKHKREKISKQKLECPFCGQAVRTLRPSLLRSARTNRNTFIAERSNDGLSVLTACPQNGHSDRHCYVLREQTEIHL